VLSRYLEQVRRFPLLSEDEEARLADEIEAGSDPAIGRLVESNLGFVVAVAREYRHHGVPFEDLLNEGNLGLVEAARRFDRRRGVRFVGYAVWWIRKRILRAIAERSTLVRLPDVQLKKLHEVRRAATRLRQSLGRDPSRSEISESLTLPAGTVEELLRLAPSMASLDAPAGERERPLADALGRIEPSTEQRLIRRDALRRVARAFDRLAARQKIVLVLRLGLSGESPLTLHEVGERVGLSGERVRQIERQAHARLRALAGGKRLVAAPPVPSGAPRRRSGAG